MFKDELGGKIMTEFCALRAKVYAYKLDDDTERKKAKGTKKCIVKRQIASKNYADVLFNNTVILKSQQRFRNYDHKVYTEEVNKIALCSNDDKRIQTFDNVTTFPYGTNMFKVCENEMLLETTKYNYSVEEKEEMNMPIIESNRTDNDLFAKYYYYYYDDDDDDDDFDLDDEWKELTDCHSDIDTKDEMIEDKIEDGEIKCVIDKIDDETDDKIKDIIDKIDDETDDKIEDMIQEEQEDKIKDMIEEEQKKNDR